MASFSPTNRAIPSKLAGAPTIRVIVDPASIEKLKRGLAIAMQAEAQRLAVDLSNRAVRFLSDLDTGIGHQFLAKLWTNTKPERQPDGSVSIEVMNQAEDLTFQTRSNAPRSNKTFPINGKSLLSILLNGAKAHTIAAHDSKVPLQFPIVRGARASRFAGTAITTAGVVGAQFLNQNKPNGMLVTSSVNHPGVVGNRFLQVAKDRLEASIGDVAPAIAARVSASI